MTMDNSVLALNLTELDWEIVGRGRKVSIRRKALPVQVPRGTVELSYMIVPAGYEVPRHRHNCDQVRYVIDGALNIDPDTEMLAGDCGYFPESVQYGPQRQVSDCLCLLMQFDGAGGIGLVPNADMEQAQRMLLAEGAVFTDGKLVANAAGPLSPPLDAYQAIWERHHGRSLTYAPARYRQPILSRPSHFAWSQERGGRTRKHLGTFGETKLTCELVQLQPGAKLPPPTGKVGEAFLVLSGAVDTGAQIVVAPGYLFVPKSSDHSRVSAMKNGCELFGIALPEHFASDLET